MIGERLAELRQLHGMTQKELANRLNVSVTTISGYENGHKNPNDDIKVQIARLFNVSLDYLLGAIKEELALDRSNVLILDRDFPEEAKPEVYEYARLMILKYKARG